MGIVHQACSPLALLCSVNELPRQQILLIPRHFQSMLLAERLSPQWRILYPNSPRRQASKAYSWRCRCRHRRSIVHVSNPVDRQVPMKGRLHNACQRLPKEKSPLLPPERPRENPHGDLLLPSTALLHHVKCESSPSATVARARGLFCIRPIPSLEPRPSSLRSDPSARPSWRGPGKTAGHLGNCKVDGSVRSQFSSFFTLTVARVPCYEMSCAYITVWATTCRFLWASTKSNCLQEKSAIDKLSDSIGNQTVDTLRVRVSKSRFWCRFWSRSCVVSVSTDSQKKAENENPIDEDLVDSTGLMEKLRKRRSTEGATGTRRVRFCSWICLHRTWTCVRLGGSEKERKGGRNAAQVSSCDVCLSPGSRSPGCCQSNRGATTRNGWRGCLHACPFDFLGGKSLPVAKAGFFDRL